MVENVFQPSPYFLTVLTTTPPGFCELSNRNHGLLCTTCGTGHMLNIFYMSCHFNYTLHEQQTLLPPIFQWRKWKEEVKLPKVTQSQSPNHYMSLTVTVFKPKKAEAECLPAPPQASVKTKPQVRNTPCPWDTDHHIITWEAEMLVLTMESLSSEIHIDLFSHIMLSPPWSPGVLEGEASQRHPIREWEKSWSLMVSPDTPRHCVIEPQMCGHQNTIVCKMFVNFPKLNISRSAPIC